MGRRWLEIAVFVSILVALFVWVGELVTRASGSVRRAGPGEGISLENGELVFWGNGKCHTCHAVGGRGRSVRGPNLGESNDGVAMAVRAVGRAEQRSAGLGRAQTPTDYLVESLTDPSAYLVEGFKDEMPVMYEPPINLTPDQLTSVVLYLQSIGGEPDPDAVRLPASARRPRTDARADWQPYLEGDSLSGRQLFFDPDGPAACVTCHRIGDDGGIVGPELTSIAGTRTPQFILEALLEPSAVIANGYEASLLETADGRVLDGIVYRETDDSLWLHTALGDQVAMAQTEIARRRGLEESIMPQDLVTNLSVAQLHDLMAFLRTLR